MSGAIEIRYFAAVRERLGCDRESVELGGGEDPSNVGEVWRELVGRHPSLQGLREHVRIAKNGEFTDDAEAVEPGDEIAIIPPVSGGSCEARQLRRFSVAREPLDRDEVREVVARDRAGAVVVFEGTVRDHTDDHRVERLQYECYEEMAVSKLEEIGEEACNRPADLSMAIHHRTGSLEVGEVAVVVAASSPHRGPAFDACRYAIDRLKEVVPIWKKEVGPGGESWVGWGP